MADDKNSREKQARDTERRQRERDISAELERGDEPEPPVETAELKGLESLDFPTTGTEIVATAGDREVGSAAGTYTVEDLLPETDDETFDSPDAVRVLIRRPTIATAMKQVIEASKTLPSTELACSQRKAYELTFRELEAIDADDDDEGIRVLTDWIAEHVRNRERLPGSRDVRQEAATFCRANGYQIRSDKWLGV